MEADKIGAIPQTTFANAFPSYKNASVSLEISLNVVPKVRIKNIASLFTEYKDYIGYQLVFLRCCYRIIYILVKTNQTWQLVNNKCWH